jgi:hypothetical protein
MNWIHKNKRALIFNGILLILFGGLIYYYQSQQSKPSADTITTIVNQATVKWCTENETTATCNPASNLYSGSASSNSVSTTVTTITPSPSPTLPPSPSPSPIPSPSPSPVIINTLCLKIASTASTDPIITSVAIESQKGDGTPITKLTNVVVTNGTVQLTDSAFLSSAIATAGNKLAVKADKHLALATLSTTAIQSGACTAYTTLTLRHGDLNNNNGIDLADISQIIALRRNGTLGYPYPIGVTLAHIGQIINYRVTAPAGDKFTI